MTDYLVIVHKSTVPLGTAEKVEAEVKKALPFAAWIFLLILLVIQSF